MAQFSPLEMKILLLTCKDYDVTKIASKADISERHVQRIRASLYSKTRTKSPLGLYKWSISKKIISK